MRMKEQRDTVSKRITVRLRPVEYAELYKEFKATTSQSLSQYLRKVLLEKPVVIHYRDAASDNMLSLLNDISRALSAIEGNFSQQVFHLRGLNDAREIQVWLELTERSRQQMLARVEAVRQALIEIRVLCAHR